MIDPIRRSVECPIERDLIFVNPQNEVTPFRLGQKELRGFSHPWMMSSIVGAAVQKHTNGDRRVIVRLDKEEFPFQPGKIAFAHTALAEDKAAYLPSEDFDEFIATFVYDFNNLAAIEKYAPSFRFVPLHLQHLLLEDKDTYRHVPRFFAKYNLADYEVLIWLNREDNQVSPKRFPEWRLHEESVLHLGGAWYACKTLDEAILIKLMAPRTEIHRIREDV
jgi:hypothetical protein